jgi:hypothetical protein
MEPNRRQLQARMATGSGALSISRRSRNAGQGAAQPDNAFFARWVAHVELVGVSAC